MAEPAATILDLLAGRGQSVAVAESLTGGLLTAALVDVPGASAVLRGGVVAYATALKHELLGVDAGLLDRVGPVDAEVAAQMAAGVRARLSADWGVAVTGVAGPSRQHGLPPGRVIVAVVGPASDTGRTVTADLPGERAEVRTGAVRLALDLMHAALGAAPAARPAGPSGGGTEQPTPRGS